MHGDIGIGLIVSWLVCYVFGVEPTWVHVVFGILFALSPDIDAVFQKLTCGSISAHARNPHDHRSLVHYPLVFVPTGTVLVFAICSAAGFGLELVLIFAVGSFLHFVHDSFGIGWGVKWLWPFSKKNYKFFVEKDNSPSKTFIQSWNPSELSEAVRLYGLPAEIWRPLYLKSPFFVVETLIFSSALGLWINDWFFK